MDEQMTGETATGETATGGTADRDAVNLVDELRGAFLTSALTDAQ